MYKDFLKKIDYNFKNINILKQAFTHSSYAYEHKMETFLNNERLEFLGDAVLELTISNYLFNSFKKMSEGELTKLRAFLVCEHSLAMKANELKLGEYILLGKGEELTGGRIRESTLSDALEAVIGAIYLDGGLEKAEKFVLLLLANDIDKDGNMDMDYKTNLQEVYQKFSQIPLKYEIIDEYGPDHDKVFTVRLSHNGLILGKGTGKNKKEAEQNAAYQAIKNNKI